MDENEIIKGNLRALFNDDGEFQDSGSECLASDIDSCSTGDLRNMLTDGQLGSSGNGEVLKEVQNNQLSTPKKSKKRLRNEQKWMRNVKKTKHSKDITNYEHIRDFQ